MPVVPTSRSLFRASRDLTTPCRLVVVHVFSPGERVLKHLLLLPHAVVKAISLPFLFCFLAGWGFWYHWYQNVDGSFFLRLWPILLANASMFETSKELVNAPFSKDSERRKQKPLDEINVKHLPTPVPSRKAFSCAPLYGDGAVTLECRKSKHEEAVKAVSVDMPSPSFAHRLVTLRNIHLGVIDHVALRGWQSQLSTSLLLYLEKVSAQAA